MENATKALLMAGGILIGIMIATFMVLVLHKGGQMSAEYDSQLSDQVLLDFNSQFEVYVGQNNTFFDVITVVNLAYDVNSKAKWVAGDGITVKIKKGGSIQHRLSDGTQIARGQMLEGETGTQEKDIYSELVKKYTENPTGEPLKKYTDTDGKEHEKYPYKFLCDGGNGIKYNQKTGRVSEVTFTQVDN